MNFKNSIWACLFVPCFLQAQVSAVYHKEIGAYRKTVQEKLIGGINPVLDKKTVKGVSFYPPTEEYKLKARFELNPNPMAFEMATTTGEPQQFIKYGSLYFAPPTNPDDTLELSIYQRVGLYENQHAEPLMFIPFKDLTNGETTYKGGRYLDIKRRNILNNTVHLDFNKAYNPYCAYNPTYNCPIAPQENHLPIRIEAGEAAFRVIEKKKRK